MSVITLFVESENANSERRFDKSMSIAQIKQRLETITGFSWNTMELKLLNKDKLVAVLNDDSKLLGFYPVENFYSLKVTDNDPYRVKNEFSDLSRVEKFEISEKEYEKRSESARQFLKMNKLGKFAEKQEEEEEDQFKDLAENIAVGMRCRVQLEEGGMEKRGTVRFVGKTEFKPGYWVGIEYDEPVGKHEGTVQGKSYFTCPSKCGVFLRPDKFETGDFPPFDDFMDSEIEEM